MCRGQWAWKKKPYTTLHQRGTFLCQKKWGRRGEISLVDMVSLACTGLLYPPLAWKVFIASRKVVQKISFVGGCARFLLPEGGGVRFCQQAPAYTADWEPASCRVIGTQPVLESYDVL